MKGEKNYHNNHNNHSNKRTCSSFSEKDRFKSFTFTSFEVSNLAVDEGERQKGK